MKAEKSHNLPSASWRPRKDGGIVLMQVQRPENRGTNDVSPTQYKGRRRPMPKLKQSDRAQILLSSAFLAFSGPQQTE